MEVKSVYIHIPFCKNICSYCDFCKVFYNENLVNQYLKALDAEIQEKYRGEKIETLYIGGGTPSVLNEKQLEELFQIISVFNLKNLKEFTIEVNPEDIQEEKLKLFKKYGINRISVGHQTKHLKYLQELNRPKGVTRKQVKLIKKYFDNVSVDFMYGFKNQTRDALLEDLDYILSLDVSHISTYSLIIEEHTKLFVCHYERLEDEEDAWMYKTIQEKLEKHGFKQYEISNFSKVGFASLHNLAYWNNEEYYGFGLGASGYIQGVRYTNTRSFQKYFSGDRVLETEVLKKEDKMIYEMILGLRKVEGVSKKRFFEKFGCNIEQIFDIMKLIDQNLIEDKDGYMKIPKQYLYLENQILVYFLEVRSESREV